MLIENFRFKRSDFKVRLYIQDAILFFSDMFLTIIQFALHPLYNLFLYFPKTYEKFSLFLSALRNILPTKNELFHTGIHWQYNIMKGFLVINKFIIKTLINISNKILAKTEVLISKYPLYIK